MRHSRENDMRRDARHMVNRKDTVGITRSEALQLLAEVPLFRGLASDELIELFRGVQHRLVPAKTLLHQQGDGSTLYVLKRGRVNIYRVTRSGRKIGVLVLTPPAAFGSMNAFGLEMDGEFAETIEPSLVCTVGAPALESLLRRRPDVSLRLLEQYGRRILALERRLEELAASTAEERLATVILRLTDEAGDMIRGLTQDDLADASGTVRQTVARILAAWRNRGIVAVTRRAIRVLRREVLQDVASTGASSHVAVQASHSD
ncbi:Crp/Fnr family transcriptional regulator [bacterium]|nr:MAG: Crp/Fnr family transcriptional regulator [bacterium]